MRVIVNGVQLRVEERGEAAKGRPTLVLLHGFMGSAADWEDHIDTFTADGVRVIALDMLGHGQSDAPPNPQRYSMEHCERDILAVLQERGVRQSEAILLGYSMGGRIALYTAFSGFFRGLILESASPGLADVAEREQRRASDEVLAARIERDGIAAFVEYWQNISLFASQKRLPPEILEAQRTKRLCNRAMGLAQSLRGVGAGVQPSLYNQLSMLNIPVLLITGEQDTTFCATNRAMLQQLPQAQLHIVPSVGHNVHLEHPQEFDRLVKDFTLLHHS